LVGRYRLEYELGRGGFGAVYRAWDLNVSRPCAVKENLDTSTEASRQFSREASVLANLSHPNLPRVTDHFIIPGQGQYLVMDYVDGEDLATIIDSQKTVPIHQAMEWVIQVADALQYLHEQEPPVLHRDIKPANIRITRKNRAMLVDFGLVKLYSPGLQTTLGARAVTPGYAPPEQYGKGKTDARTDIYALAATLYHMITGIEPLESVQRVSGEAMQTANQVNKDIPISLSQVIERSLALDPANRFQSVTEFRNAIMDNPEKPAGIIQPERTEMVKQYPAAPPSAPAVKNPPISKPLSSEPIPQAPASPAKAGGQLASQPPARSPSQASPRPASQPLLSTRKVWIPATTLVIVIIFCLLASLVVGGLLLTSGPSNAEITATVQMQRTLSAGLQATSTYFYQIQATQTAIAGPSP
jgi:serine/threonine-protein kinase